MLRAMNQFRDIWNSDISIKMKKNRYLSLVLSKGIWGIHMVGLTSDDLRYLDYIHARCLRRILKIPAAYVSRISNAEVLRRAATPSFSAHLRKRQMHLLGHVLRCDNQHPDRKVVFARDSARQRPSEGFQKKRGRPRKNWYGSIVPQCLEGLHLTHAQLLTHAQDRNQWKVVTERLCATL